VNPDEFQPLRTKGKVELPAGINLWTPPPILAELLGQLTKSRSALKIRKEMKEVFGPLIK
jgi:hypothetical protein